VRGNVVQSASRFMRCALCHKFHTAARPMRGLPASPRVRRAANEHLRYLTLAVVAPVVLLLACLQAAVFGASLSGSSAFLLVAILPALLVMVQFLAIPMGVNFLGRECAVCPQASPNESFVARMQSASIFLVMVAAVCTGTSAASASYQADGINLYGQQVRGDAGICQNCNPLCCRPQRSLHTPGPVRFRICIFVFGCCSRRRSG
jgi:hypothetical protein